MNNERQTLKAINRHFRKHENAFTGGQSFGVDYSTWRVMYPHTSNVYSQLAETFTGKASRYMPPIFR